MNHVLLYPCYMKMHRCNKQLNGKYQLKSSIFLPRRNCTTLTIYIVLNVLNHRGQYAFQGILLQRLITAFKLFMYIMHSYLTWCIMNSRDITHTHLYPFSIVGTTTFLAKKNIRLHPYDLTHIL